MAHRVLRCGSARLHRSVGPSRHGPSADIPCSDSPNGANELTDVSVLVVDDDEDTRELIAEVIRRAGYSVVTAHNGRHAIDRLHSIRPQLILLDVQMPVMDGLTFRQEQRRNRDWIRIPTVVMSGVAEERVLDVAIEDTLRKPIPARRILDLVMQYCTK